MNRILIVILIAFSFKMSAQEKVELEKPHIDRKVELLSIVFRLAERPEYSSNVFKLYYDRIEQYFEEYKNHELIQFTKSIIGERGLSYDSPMWMAIYLDDNMKPLTNVSSSIWQRDPRWTKENVEKFIPLLQQFAKDTKFDVFFNENTDLYNDAVKCFATMYEPLDLNWYLNFYGKEPSETFSIILGLVSYSNYGPSIDYTDGSRKVFSIVGVLHSDSTGMPKFEYNPLASITIIHEFHHSFINYLIDKNKEAFRESGEKIFSVVKETMAKQAYNTWEIMMYEALVRAAVIKYVKDSDYYQNKMGNYYQQMIEFLINSEKENGFFWIEELVAELESYNNQRGVYPTLENYLPKLIEAYNTWAEKIQVNTLSNE